MLFLIRGLSHCSASLSCFLHCCSSWCLLSASRCDSATVMTTGTKGLPFLTRTGLWVVLQYLFARQGNNVHHKVFLAVTCAEQCWPQKQHSMRIRSTNQYNFSTVLPRPIMAVPTVPMIMTMVKTGWMMVSRMNIVSPCTRHGPVGRIINKTGRKTNYKQQQE